MAVYERTYRSYSGTLTPERTRFLVLPRYAYEEVFRSKFFVTFLIACGLLPLVYSVLIYVPHNLGFLEKFGLTVTELPSFFKFEAPVFRNYMRWTIPLSAMVSLIVGPALISADLRNNGLPLYLSRPFSRTEYILGKTSVLIILLSAVSWIPALVLFFFQAYMAGFSWLVDNLRIGFAILLSGWILIFLLCLISLALSAYLKWKPLARIAFLGVFFVAAALGSVINLLVDTKWGSLINFTDMIDVVWSQLFGVASDTRVPAAAAWLSLLTMCAVCLGLLARKVRAYEVVR